MSKAMQLKSVISSVGATLAVGALLSAPLHADEENLFDSPELSSAYQVASHHGKGHKMKMMDADGDGVISKEEFMSHAEKKFSKKDANDDGVLSGDEMKKGCQGKHKKGKEGAKA